MRSAFQIRLREGGSRVGLLAGTMFAAVMAMGVMPGPAAADPPTAISLALSSPTVVADGASTVTAIATLTGDTTGNEPVTIISDKGDETVSAVTHTGGATSGQYQATIKSSKALETATITAADNNIVALNVRSASKQLQQTLGPPATITLKLAPSTITAGSSTTETAEVLDAGQHPLDSQLRHDHPRRVGDARRRRLRQLLELLHHKHGGTAANNRIGGVDFRSENVDHRPRRCHRYRADVALLDCSERVIDQHRDGDGTGRVRKPSDS